MTDYAKDVLVSTDWVADHLNDDLLRIVEVDETPSLYDEAHIPGAKVGADDPLLAFEDALRDFEADHILVALRPDEEAGWQERGLLDQVRERFSLPTTVFEVR